MPDNGLSCGQCGAQDGSLGARAKTGVWITFAEMKGLNSDNGAALFDDGMPLERTARVFVNAAGSTLCAQCNLRYYAPGMLRSKDPGSPLYVRKIEKRLARGQVPLPGDRWLE
jgi:hypothetical protein